MCRGDVKRDGKDRRVARRKGRAGCGSVGSYSSGRRCVAGVSGLVEEGGPEIWRLEACAEQAAGVSVGTSGLREGVLSAARVGAGGFAALKIRAAEANCLGGNGGGVGSGEWSESQRSEEPK